MNALRGVGRRDHLRGFAGTAVALCSLSALGVARPGIAGPDPATADAAVRAFMLREGIPAATSPASPSEG